MNDLGYEPTDSEMEMVLDPDPTREPDIDAIEENQVDALEDNLSSLPDSVVIGAFISWLWKMGYNEWIIKAVEKLILKGEERKNG